MMSQHIWTRTFVLTALFLFSSTAFASQEGILTFSDINVHSKGIGSSGPIKITAKGGKKCSFTNFNISAFGKSYTLSKNELKTLHSCYNGILLSYERGYRILGGKTLYITLMLGFTSGIRKKTLIRFNQKGVLKITLPKKKK